MIPAFILSLYIHKIYFEIHAICSFQWCIHHIQIKT